jgi:dipeptidyl-peptidase-4
MAERGFIVFTLDNHGSGNRGKAFEQATFRNLGTVEMQDQLSGVDYIKSLSYVDGSRIGVNGWSFGGFMTTSLMTRNPGIYKVGVAGGPVIDWSAYEIMYTERYMDSPAQNPDGYKASNLLNYVDQLKGKLLMIHGTSDDVVVWQNSLMYVKKAVSKNNLFLDYYVYPGHLHNVSGKDRVHLMGKISQYFIENL